MLGFIRIGLVLSLTATGGYFMAGDDSPYKRSIKNVFDEVDRTLQSALDHRSR
jgi:hypothetical protein